MPYNELGNIKLAKQNGLDNGGGGVKEAIFQRLCGGYRLLLYFVPSPFLAKKRHFSPPSPPYAGIFFLWPLPKPPPLAAELPPPQLPKKRKKKQKPRPTDRSKAPFSAFVRRTPLRPVLDERTKKARVLSLDTNRLLYLVLHLVSFWAPPLPPKW